jgi:hypothetical protein
MGNEILSYNDYGLHHTYVPLQGGGILAFRLLLEERPDLLTPERVARMAGLTLEDVVYARHYLAESGPWDAAYRAALLAALSAVPTLSEIDWEALWEDVAP